MNPLQKCQLRNEFHTFRACKPCSLAGMEDLRVELSAKPNPQPRRTSLIPWRPRPPRPGCTTELVHDSCLADKSLKQANVGSIAAPDLTRFRTYLLHPELADPLVQLLFRFFIAGVELVPVPGRDLRQSLRRPAVAIASLKWEAPKKRKRFPKPFVFPGRLQGQPWP